MEMDEGMQTPAHFLARKVQATPDRLVFTVEGGGTRPDETRTFAQWSANAHRIAAALVARGLAPGDCFALLMRNHAEFIEALFAASIAACVVVPVDPRTRGDKLAHMLRDSGSRGVICADYALAQVIEVAAQVPSLEWALVLESGEEPGSASVADCAFASPLGEVLAAPARHVDIRLRAASDPLQIIYTSGTTGDPKGVVFPNARFLGSFGTGRSVYGWTEDDRPYTGLSLTHGNAQSLTFAPALGMDLPVVFSRRFTKSRLWDVCRRYGCTTFNLLGGMSTAIYAEPARPDDRDHKVRLVISAGMPAAIWEAFERRFGVRILELYGAIEGGFAFKPVGVGPIGSFGRPPANLEMRIVDDDGRDCAPGVVGELVSRPVGGTPHVEYFRNADASRRKTEGGWLRSGDMCHRDADGWYYFDYRKGGGIRHNGDFINPGFVERVLAEQPDVVDVFVYGVPARSGAPGEKDVVAAIVPAGGVAAFDAAAAARVFAACRRGLEANAVPDYLQVVAEIPKTASEKPQERFLLAAFAPDAPGVHVREGRG
jgi:crotonobetaine/carnitine-CoA ligase